MQEEFGVYNLFLNCLFWLKVNPLKINLLKVLILTPMQSKSIDLFLYMWKFTVNGLTSYCMIARKIRFNFLKSE